MCCPQLGFEHAITLSYTRYAMRHAWRNFQCRNNYLIDWSVNQRIKSTNDLDIWVVHQAKQRQNVLLHPASQIWGFSCFSLDSKCNIFGFWTADLGKTSDLRKSYWALWWALHNQTDRLISNLNRRGLTWIRSIGCAVSEPASQLQPITLRENKNHLQLQLAVVWGSGSADSLVLLHYQSTFND